MKANEKSFLSFLQGLNQYLIPIYQRKYSWSEEECEQLWDDVVRVAKSDDIPSHFIGSIVYIHQGIYEASAVTPLFVIDGQQRLTTLTLLLAAMAKEINEENCPKNITKKKIENYYLFNNDEEGEKRYKLILTDIDKKTLISTLDDSILPEKQSKRILDNFNYFREQIKKSQIDLDFLHKGLQKLIMVDISLDSNYDDSQLIFESLNSTGVKLSQTDLIRNFILMGLEPDIQKKIYENFWQPMEQNFDYHNIDSKKFDRFMRDYLTIKLNEIPKEDDVYAKFKEYFYMQGKNTHDLIQKIASDIYDFSQLFIILAFEKTDDVEIRQKIHNINSLNVEVVYPFLLEVFSDYYQNESNETKLTKHDLLIILDMIESYVFRRQICEVPTNSLNKTFATLYGLIDKDNYLDSLKAIFIIKDSYRRFPNDSEFNKQFMIKNVYKFRSRSYLFNKLENFDRKEPVSIDEYTLEHIMPQNENLSNEWRKELGKNWQDIHRNYLHRIGNLTLTGYNAKLSDKPFHEKQTMVGGFKDSPIRLNSELSTITNWNETEIQNRSQRLANKALEIWKYPNLPQNILEKYNYVDDDDDTDVENWEIQRAAATERIKEIQDKLIEKICSELNCHVEPSGEYLAFYISKPYKRKNKFAVLSCGVDTSRIMFRIDPENFKDDDDRIKKLSGWFFPRHTERRMSVSHDDIPFIMEHIKIAYNVTQNLN